MSVGATLKGAREKLGLSAEQISERTKVQLPKIEALESGSFAGLPRGLYPDGIVRAYANEVGLPAMPLIDRVRQEQAEEHPEAVSADVPADLSGFHSEKELKDLIVSKQGRPVSDAAPVTRSIDFVIDPPSVPLFTHSSVPPDYPALRRAKSSQPGLLHSFGRAVVMLALLAAIGWAAYSFQIYRLSHGDRTAAAPLPPTEVRVSDAAANETAAPVPEDNRVGSSGAQSSSRPADAGSPPPIGPNPNARETSATQSETSSPGSSTSPTDNVVSTRPARDVSGSWTLSTQLESSSYARFAGLHLGYEINLQQSGNRILGSGRKVTENGTGVGSRAQTPIRVAGTIDGDRLTLIFTEEGTRRTTDGKFVLLLDEDGTLRGRFSSTAAQSSGTVEARRVTSR